MDFSHGIVLVVLGLLIGTVSGMVGIGGGILAIPAMMFLLGFSQAKANGTTLAMMLPPIGLFAAMAYARAGNVDWKVALLMASGFVFGAYFGAVISNNQWVSPNALRLAFAALLLYVAGKLLFRSGGFAAAALETSALIAAYFTLYLTMRLLGRNWAHSHTTWGRFYRHRQRLSHTHEYDI